MVLGIMDGETFTQIGKEKTMKEYVEKDDVINIVESIISTDYNWQLRISDALTTINNMEYVCLPDIVKCKDCKWSKTIEYMFFSCLECTNPKGLDRIVSKQEYCCCGERE